MFLRLFLSNLVRPQPRTILSGIHVRTSASTTSPKMRVPYAPNEPPNEEARPIYERIAERRKPRPLIPLDLALLHNPAVADGWNSFIGAIRTKTSLPANLKELAISRIAVLNHAVHEWDVHAALALKAGVSKQVLQTVFDLPVTRHGEVEKEGLLGFSKEEYAVMVYTDQMTVGVQVEDGVAEMVKSVLEDTMVVELTATVAAYNAVSRFLVALDVGECNDRGMKKVDEL
ncbi:carboxymuconolactone decarboxylase [Alternaria alternata]|nr:carboxymuconolactone decarboxylase [Alternaria alternata]